MGFRSILNVESTGCGVQILAPQGAALGAESGVCGEPVSQPLALFKRGPSFVRFLRRNLGVTG